jgi:outer membrane biosynthesis protein TonB
VRSFVDRNGYSGNKNAKEKAARSLYGLVLSRGGVCFNKISDHLHVRMSEDRAIPKIQDRLRYFRLIKERNEAAAAAAARNEAAAAAARNEAAAAAASEIRGRRLESSMKEAPQMDHARKEKAKKQPPRQPQMDHARKEKAKKQPPRQQVNKSQKNRKEKAKKEKAKKKPPKPPRQQVNKREKTGRNTSTATETTPKTPRANKKRVTPQSKTGEKKKRKSSSLTEVNYDGHFNNFGKGYASEESSLGW